MKRRFSLRSLLLVVAFLGGVFAAWGYYEQIGTAVTIYVENGVDAEIWLNEIRLGRKQVRLSLADARRLGIGPVLDQHECELNLAGVFLRNYSRADGSYPRIHLRISGKTIPFSACGVGNRIVNIYPNLNSDVETYFQLGIQNTDVRMTLKLPTEIRERIRACGTLHMYSINLVDGTKGAQTSTSLADCPDQEIVTFPVTTPHNWQKQQPLAVSVRINVMDGVPFEGLEFLDFGTVLFPENGKAD